MVTTQHLIDNNNLTGYSQALLDIDYPSGTISARYDYGDDLFAQIDDPKSAAPTAHYFLYDGLGSTRSLTNRQGAIEQTYSYKPFGEANGFDPSSENQLTRNLFTGEQFDSETGYYHLRARQYDPGIGRFTSFDPAEDFNNRLHKYNYCASEPINGMDPSGRDTGGGRGLTSLIGMLIAVMIVGILASMYFRRGKISATSSVNRRAVFTQVKDDFNYYDISVNGLNIVSVDDNGIPHRNNISSSRWSSDLALIEIISTLTDKEAVLAYKDRFKMISPQTWEHFITTNAFDDTDMSYGDKGGICYFACLQAAGFYDLDFRAIDLYTNKFGSYYDSNRTYRQIYLKMDSPVEDSDRFIRCPGFYYSNQVKDTERSKVLEERLNYSARSSASIYATLRYGTFFKWEEE